MSNHVQHVIKIFQALSLLISNSVKGRGEPGSRLGGSLLPGKLSLHSDKLISCKNDQAACEAGKCPKSAGEAILKWDFPANPGDLTTML